MQLVIAEKHSVGSSIAKVLGVNNQNDGYIEGNGYIVTWCVGHLVKLSKPVYVQKTSLKIMKIGIAPFGINMSPMVSIFFMNAIHFIMAEL